ncbi:MAG: DNA replication/repair protein RecF [Pseudomonadales bacterium]|nr:DNA replication/repair protein RecF [Pseudomonadales bacterium]
MSLDRLQVHNIRNISAAQFDLHDKLNFFLGGNGSGKTSILEAVYFLGTGRSFRTNKIDPLITKGQKGCLVVGSLFDQGIKTQIGIERHLKGGRTIKVNGETQLKSSQLARQLPILQLGPHSIDLLIGSPNLRRRFLNWGVFHVEPKFAHCWDMANRCLKQRNLLLHRSSPRSSELSAWTKELIVHSELLDNYRRNYWEKFMPVFTEICENLPGLSEVNCDYIRGWNKAKSLELVFAAQEDIDIGRQYTQSGFQRADLRMTHNGYTASSICSRGELKVLSWALILAQGLFLYKYYQRNVVYLVDDMCSELDQVNRAEISRLLLQTGGQIFVTGIDEEPLLQNWQQIPRKVFHVKQGTFSLQEFDYE